MVRQLRLILWITYFSQLAACTIWINQKNEINFLHPAALIALVLNVGITFALIEMLSGMTSWKSVRESTSRRKRLSIAIATIFTIYLILTLGSLDLVPRTYHIQRAPYLDVLLVNVLGGIALYVGIRPKKSIET